ncbi:MAG: HEAT repeat domain-containing protein [Phycisphaerae bacterium]|jgi:hypothetical protein|nr:HEAT repeat domain-containing protein [Phycisphaerae bacterium]HOO15852.1 HEAT repeat domain-containing protein [Phycisphaerae bacterium]HPC22101.1 HEAT repeat domain-containing protein [Phycisphaerae bacterium]HRS28167.1 HEAT repeat domain-containing protein [Phycisphaerae bacterium]HRT42308.1 HEAT repeat domain-containing protein [Phycisphaerae bacterium]
MQARNRLRCCAAWAALPAVVLLLAGCSDAKINAVVVKIFEPRRTPQQNLVTAFSSEDPDVRRDSLGKVAKSKLHDEDWAVKGYITIALLDTEPQARCVAIRALVRTEDPRAAETLLKLLNYREHPPQEVRPPDTLIRWDATLGLARLSERDAVPPELRESVEQTLIERLRMDEDAQVLTAAARGLGYYPSEDAVRALIGGLNGTNFAAVHECEESLVRLTGYTHNCDPLAWQDWLEGHRDDLFARAGHIPESRRPPYSNRFEKVGYDVKQFWRWLVPARKEQ